MHRRSMALAIAALALAPGVQAQTAFPNKPVRLVVTYPPGGTVDVAARILGTKLAQIWGQPVVIDNRAGGGGIIGAQAVLTAPADGYTLMVDASNPAQNPALKKRMPFDTLKSFAPVSLLVKVPSVLVVNPAFAAQSPKDLVAYSVANPGRLDFASSGNGSAQHLAAELFALKTGAKMTHVAYRGGGPAIADLLAGHVDLSFMTALEASGHIKAGKLRALAVTSDKRLPALPDVPTLAEGALPGFNAISWIGLLAPAGTPQDTVDKISADLRAVLADE
ncbi:MAG: tripartite tricarboxylate transporter substrate binding protein, partial [Comamonas sp.]